MKTSRIFLTCCIVLGIVGLTPPGGDFCYGILRPLSAVFFILAFASGVLEAAQADHEKYTETHAVKAAEPKTSTSDQFHGDVAAAH